MCCCPHSLHKLIITEWWAWKNGKKHAFALIYIISLTISFAYIEGKGDELKLKKIHT